MKKYFLSLSVICATLCTALQVNAQTVVSNCELNGWATAVKPTATLNFVSGPATPPLGKGSVKFTIGDAGGQASLSNNTFAGTKLADITKLTYSTYVVNSGSGPVAPALNLSIDLDGNGTADDYLNFEPVYQTGTFYGDKVPSQYGGEVQLNTWQTWDALAGGWWGESTVSRETFQIRTLETYIAAHPDATIARVSTAGADATVPGGLIISTGGGNTWTGFEGYVDALTIGTKTMGTTTYNFEPCTTTNEGNKKVIVCHNGKDLEIAASALKAHLAHGDKQGSCGTSAKSTTSSENATSNKESGAPQKITISNYPNPFTDITRINYSLPAKSNVSIKVFDISGKQMADLVNGSKEAGTHSVEFNAAGLGKGVYYYKINVADGRKVFNETKSMTLIK